MERILGQAAAMRTLQAAADSGRIHHAWIFHGPLGVGKYTAAIEFAALLLDPDAAPDLAGHVRSDPGGRTASLVRAGTHPDLHVIRKELALYSSNKELRSRKMTNIPIDLLREHMIGGVTNDGKHHEAPVFHTARLGHGKVFIIEEAELLDDVGQNALLKTLEEPPKRTYIILVTTKPDRLLPTIRSRCQRVAFTPLGAASMSQWLATSGFDVKGEERAWLLEFAAGSPGMAMMAREDGLYQWQNAINPILSRLDQGRFAAGVGEMLAGLVDEYATAWVKKHDNASKDMANKAGARRVFMVLGAHARRRLHEAAARDESPARWADVIDVLGEGELAIDANVNQKMVFENLASQWALAAIGHASPA